MNSCSLEEIKFTGSKYTWLNVRIGEDCLFKRLDTILGNRKIFEILVASEVTRVETRFRSCTFTSKMQHKQCSNGQTFQIFEFMDNARK